MQRVHFLAAEIFGYSFEHYADHLGVSLRFDRLIPQQGGFLVGFVLGDRALAAARAAGLPCGVMETIAGARRYAEGTGFRAPVASSEDLTWVRELVRIKLGS